MIRITTLLVFLTGLVSQLSAQTVIMGEPGYPLSNPANCTTFGVAGTNFQDPGGGGNYTANFNDTIVFCPDLNLGTKMTATFAINAGFTFNVDGSDFIYVYDGPSTASPLMGMHNSVTDPNGFTHQASWNNPSGCLTIVFISNGSVQGTGWDANVQCGNQFQPFTPHIEAYINGEGVDVLNPADTGFVDICFGDSILFITKPVFPNSEEITGFGYSQDVNSTIDFLWEITDGAVYPNNDSIWFLPPARAGYLIDLTLTDEFPQIEKLRCKVRVSQLPSFAGTGPLDDVICLGESTTLVGGVTVSDTVGVEIPAGEFNLGGNFAGLTYLPDGSGQQYQAPIQIGGFPSGATVQDAQSLNQVCITMEHSYLGDLEIWLQCPSGLIVPLVNSFGGGYIPGGNSGGGTFLGHPFDDVQGGGAGEGWEYCFSSVFNDIGPMTQNLGNTVPVAFIPGTPNLSAGNSIDPSNTYAPETTFASFAGCPVNGTWTIFVQDNLGTDDGYIFEWGLYFDPSYFPGLGSYQNTVESSFWSTDPTIISGQNDTLITVQPNVTGVYGYTFNVVDDFGCPYDTTVNLLVQELPEIFNDTIGCDFTFQVAGTTSVAGGVWSTTAANLTISPSLTTNNPTITSSLAGTYPVTFTDVACNYVVESLITFPAYPVIFDDTSLCNLAMQVAGTQAFATGGVWTASSPLVSFSPSNTTLNPNIISTTSGSYIITFTDNVCNNSVSTNLAQIQPPSIFSDTIGCNHFYQINNTFAFDGGSWFVADTAIHFVPSEFESNPLIYTSTPGTYTLTFTDNYCNQSVTADVYFPPYAYTQVLDTAICIGATYTIYALENPTVDNFVWNNGATGPVITISQPGDYTVTASNICHSFTDVATIGIKECDIDAPNIIVLSSTVGNNIFYVQYAGVAEFECTIFNRWGNKIYQYGDPASGWDGKTFSGTLVEEGTYFYIIKATFEGGSETTKQGFVQVKY